MYRLQQFLSPFEMLTLCKGPARPCIHSACGGVPPFWTESMAFVSTPLLLLTVFCLLYSVEMLLPSLSPAAIHMLTAPVKLLIVCLTLLRRPAEHAFLLSLSLMLFKFLMQELATVFILSSIQGKPPEQFPFICISSFAQRINAFERSLMRHVYRPV